MSNFVELYLNSILIFKINLIDDSFLCLLKFLNINYTYDEEDNALYLNYKDCIKNDKLKTYNKLSNGQNFIEFGDFVEKNIGLFNFFNLDVKNIDDLLVTEVYNLLRNIVIFFYSLIEIYNDRTYDEIYYQNFISNYRNKGYL